MENVASLEKYKLPRNYFPRGRTRISSYRPGYIYPVWSDYVLPGDTIKLSIENVTRQLPTISPSYSNFTITYRTFFVALRNLWKDFPQWLTGFKTYNKALKFEEDVPRWTPSSAEITRPGSLWTSLGFPMNTLPHKMPADFKRQAYGYFWEKYCRYQPFQDSILNEEQEPGTWTGENFLEIVRDRDIFTTGIPDQQLGDPLALPITGQTKATWEDGTDEQGLFTSTLKKEGVEEGYFLRSRTTANTYLSAVALGGTAPDQTTIEVDYSNILNKKAFTDKLNNNTVDMTDIASVTIAMLREAVQIQLFREMLSRAGLYYDDVLILNWGTAPSDETLGYPVYIGGNKINIITSEVLQTSSTTADQPLGQLGGHGLGVGESGEMQYTAKEFGVIMTVMYIKTNNLYGMQQLNKLDLFESNLDMPWIMLQHLSEQPMKKSELYCKSTKVCYWDEATKQRKWGNDISDAEQYNTDTLMYREIYDQWRYEIYGNVDGLLALEQLAKDQTGEEYTERLNYYNWSEAIFFDIKNPPAMNDDFLSMRTDNRNYAAIDITENHLANDNFLIYTKVKADFWRVLDLFGTPGRLDHIA